MSYGLRHLCRHRLIESISKAQRCRLTPLCLQEVVPFAPDVFRKGLMPWKVSQVGISNSN